MTLKPYYEHDNITIYHGDSRKILPHLHGDTIITDPVWPNALDILQGSEDPWGLFRDVAKYFPAVADRAVVIMGCNSDPRFLTLVPAEMPFKRICHLEYPVPSYKGRILNEGDYAYVFGKCPSMKKQYQRRVLPGKVISSDPWLPHERKSHPCERRLSHLLWIVRWYSDQIIIDPFMGGGTTLVAAKVHRKKAIGIEIEEKYCEIAATRLAQDYLL